MDTQRIFDLARQLGIRYRNAGELLRFAQIVHDEGISVGARMVRKAYEKPPPPPKPPPSVPGRFK